MREFRLEALLPEHVMSPLCAACADESEATSSWRGRRRGWRSFEGFVLLELEVDAAEKHIATDTK